VSATENQAVEFVDALGRAVAPPSPPQRVVSLVPSITEALVAYGVGDRLVGRTEFCVEPAGKVEHVGTVGGTKTLDVDAIAALKPDLVIASAEENEQSQVESLIASGMTVYVIEPRTVQQALVMLADVARMTGVTARALPAISEASRTLAQIKREAESSVRFFCPIWRRPYMAAGPDTYIHDLLESCGGLNVFRDRSEHYPEVEMSEVAARDPEVILLPDEPYPFAEKHLPEIRSSLADTTAVREDRVHLVDGKLLCWYGPRINAALFEVSRLLAV
jgi:ABC-type Fe3+-hydroxamate transport system substrate-binding protein